MDDSDPMTVLMQANLHEVFGQRDSALRREAMRRTYAADVAFTDPEGTVYGYDAIEGKVASLLDKTPQTFVFAADGPVYVLNDTAALLWTFGPRPGPPVARGIDIATIANGRIAALQTLLKP